jgi:hypothetical protein
VPGQYTYYYDVTLQADVTWDFHDQGFYVDPKDQADLSKALADFKNSNNVDPRPQSYLNAVGTLDRLMIQPPLRDQAAAVLGDQTIVWDADHAQNVMMLLGNHPACPVSVTIFGDGTATANMLSGTTNIMASAAFPNGAYLNDTYAQQVASVGTAPGDTLTNGNLDHAWNGGLIARCKLNGIKETNSGILDVTGTWTDNDGNEHDFLIRKSFSCSAWAGGDSWD